jgi:hypothetical protein
MTSEGDAGASLQLINTRKATHQRAKRERILKKDTPVFSKIILNLNFLNVIKCLRAQENLSYVFKQDEVIVRCNVAFNG